MNLADVANLRPIPEAIAHSARVAARKQAEHAAFAAAIDAECEAEGEAFRRRMVAPLPRRWQTNALRQWEQRRKTQDEAEASRWLLGIGELANACKMPPDASDSDLSERAAKTAQEANSLLTVFKGADAARSALERFCKRQGIESPCPKLENGPAIARMTDETWWRKALRRLHNRQTEDLARALGYVHIRADPYCSNETLNRRREQNRRNRATLERTDLASEDGEILNLAEIADASLANKAIRRAELLTRVRGYEDIAREHTHAALFLTITCPSRMHPRLAESGTENPRYDGTAPRAAHDYLQGLWERIRAKLDRAGIRFYGLRIAEPHHDGTPHWHMLFFCESEHQKTVTDVMRHYALLDSPNEPGAQEYRFKSEVIDWQRGGAVSYVVKYVCKNVDGQGIETDLDGVEGTESAERAEAWARAVGIRQFQAFGGPAVSLWRELRRIGADAISNACDAVKRAWTAAQKTAEQRANFAEFIRACGGIGVSRADCLLSLATEEKTYQGRYGSVTAVRPVGIKLTHLPERVYRSARKAWTAIRRPTTGEPSAPWTRVNNCTPLKNQRVTNAWQEQASAPPWWTDAIEAETTGYDADGFLIGSFGAKRREAERKSRSETAREGDRCANKKDVKVSEPATFTPHRNRMKGAFGYGYAQA